MKKKILIIFKAQWDWNRFIINKISKFYNVKYIYLNTINKNYSNTIGEINKIIKEEKIDTVFFDVDYQKFINFYFIEKIKNVKKVMMTFDNYERHVLNMITACSCHLVLTDNISALKYKEVGISAFNWFLESDGYFYKDLKLDKKIDVLFFGKINKNRKDYINFLENNGVKVKIVGNNIENYVSDENLVRMINESKIVINFTKTTWKKLTNFLGQNIFQNQYQLKGRIVQTGLCNTACVTEYAPHHDLLYKSDELLQFTNKEECLDILKNLLNNEDELINYTKKFSDKTRNSYEDSKSFKKVYNFLEKTSLSNQTRIKKNLKKVPYWYKRICAKQILLRDLRLSTILQSLSNFREISIITKTSNIFTILLIFLETGINFIYYSILNTLRAKGSGKNRYTDEL